MILNPAKDGITHINVYSKGKTKLGRLLSNFAHTPFYHPDFGEFQSIEGLWYWLSSNHPDKDDLKSLYGYEAKKVGREQKAIDWNTTDSFKKDILKGLQAKYDAYPEIQELLLQNSLPLVHYYVMQGKIIVPEEGKWILDFWEGK